MKFSSLPSKFLVALFIFASAFPYTQIISSQSYTQPYAIATSIFLFIFAFKYRNELILKSDMILMFVFFVYGCVLFGFACWTSGLNIQTIKYLTAYIVPVVVVISCGWSIKKSENLFRAVLAFSAILWIVVGWIQYTCDPSFATALVGDWGNVAEDMSASGRGVLGLAPEPTHHGFHLILLAAALFLIGKSKAEFILAYACIFGAVFVAASSSVVFVLAVSAIVYVLIRKPALLLIVFISAVYAESAVNLIDESFYIANSRLFNLLCLAVSDPVGFISEDSSVNARIGGALATWSYLISEIFIPHGLSHESWLLSREVILNEYSWVEEISTNGPPSGFGTIVYQGGLFCLFFVGWTWKWFVQRTLAPQKCIVVGAIPWIFMGQYYISSTMLWILVAIAMHKLSLAKIQNMSNDLEEL